MYFAPLIIFPLFCGSNQQDVAEKDFVQLTYTDAVELLLKAKKKFEFPVCKLKAFEKFRCH